MKEINTSTSACRFCRYYEPEGRRGGSCQMLGVPVQSSWSACSLALPPFETTLTKLENIFQLKTTIPLNSPVRLASERLDQDLESDLSQMVSPKLE
ncbi:MAG: hypothetical protein AAFQ14_20045 [Cyanobacteria bacterium J06621_12]